MRVPSVPSVSVSSLSSSCCICAAMVADMSRSAMKFWSSSFFSLMRFWRAVEEGFEEEPEREEWRGWLGARE